MLARATMAKPLQQKGLFGPLDDERPGPKQVAPAPVGDDVRALAATLPSTLRLGTSSWNFPGWRGLVYAADAPLKLLSRDGLRAYAQHPLLRTVGVDRSFYAPVGRDEFAAYADQVPADFRFLVKGLGDLLLPRRPGETRPNAHYLAVERFTAECVEPAVGGLGDRLGVLLLQFPPQGPELTREPRLFADLLHAFLRRLPAGVPYAVELRDGALLTAAYADALRDTGARHGFVLHPSMPDLATQRAVIARGDRPPAPLVVRWMLHQGFAYEQAKERYEPFAALRDPDPAGRAAIAALVRDTLRAGVEATVVVNNKAEGSSPCSVAELARVLAAAAPPSIVP